MNVVNLRSRFDENLSQISDSKNLGWWSEYKSTNPVSKPWVDIMILGWEFKFSAKNIKCAAIYLKFRYQTGCIISHGNLFIYLYISLSIYLPVYIHRLSGKKYGYVWSLHALSRCFYRYGLWLPNSVVDVVSLGITCAMAYCQFSNKKSKWMKMKEDYKDKGDINWKEIVC